MTASSNLLLFSVATLLVVMAPGPGMLFVISRGLVGGKKAGTVAALGTSAGIAVHIAFTAFGLSLIIFASEMGFLLTKWAGGSYLIFLAWKSFIHGKALALDSGSRDRGFVGIFWQGLFVNALNPKVALFFLAFIPQFMTPSSGSVAMQSLILGTVFFAFTVVVFLGYGICASLIRTWLLERPNVYACMNWATGSLFVFLGVRLILSRPQ